MSAIDEAVAHLKDTLNGYGEDGRIWVNVSAVRRVLEELDEADTCHRTNAALTANAGYCHAIDTLRKALTSALSELERTRTR